MINRFKHLAFISLSLILISLVTCSDDKIINPADQEYTLKGFVQKGPFQAGAQITVHLLNNSLNQSGQTLSTETINNLGYFEFQEIIKTNLVEIVAIGYYYNEVAGILSPAPITLRAVADLSSSDSVNVNVLTNLSIRRIKHLVTSEKMGFKEAKSKAEKEVLAVFNISDSTISGFESMDITRSGKHHAVLLGLSCILQGNQNVAQLTELISKISVEIETDGIQNDSTIAAQLLNNSINLNVEMIRTNIQNRYNQLGLTFPIPDFENYVKLLVPVKIVSTYPYAGTLNAPISSEVVVQFNKVMNAQTINNNSFFITQQSNRIEGTINYDPYYRRAIFRSAENLKYESEYLVTLTNEIRSLDGITLDSMFIFKFSTLLIPAPYLNYPSNYQTINLTSPVLDWTDVQDAAGYALQISTKDDFSDSILVNVNLSSSEFPVSTPFGNNKKYFWRVRTQVSDGRWGPWGMPFIFSVKLDLVKSPSPQNGAYIKDTTPLFDWEDVSNTAIYHIQLNDKSDFTGNMIAESEALSESEYQLLTPLEDEKYYYWRVKRKNNDGIWSDWNIYWSFKILMDKPNILYPLPGSTIINRQPLLKWSSVTGQTGYHLQLNKTDNFNTTNIVDDSSLIHNEYQMNTPLEDETQYFLRLRVRNSDGVWSAWTQTQSFLVPRLDIISNLLFYYPFNETTDDESGNDNHATPFGLIWSNDRFGNPNSALNFNNYGDYLQMPGVKQLWNSDWTYSIWFKLDVVPSPSMVDDAFILAYKGIKFEDDVHLYVDDVDARIKAYLGRIGPSGISGTVSNIKISTGVQTQQNIWYHAVITHRVNPPQIEIYVDGYRKTASNNKFGTTYSVAIPYHISCIGVFDDPRRGRFLGTIDDVRFYDRVLNSYEIQVLFDESSAGKK